MSKLKTQKEIMSDVLDGLMTRYSFVGWNFKHQKTAGIKNVVRGKNKQSDQHFMFAIPTLLIQESNMDYFDTLDSMVFKPINRMMVSAKSNEIKE